MSARHLEELIQALFDGSATEGDARELQEILRTDTAARRVYLEYAGLHQSLEYRFARASAIPGRQGAVVQKRLNRQRRKTVIVSLVTACAAMIALALVMKALLAPVRPPAVVFRAAPESLFRIEHAPGVEAAEGILEEGSRMRLAQGTLELDLAGGTRAVVQGPADFVVDGAASLRLSRGTAWFLVAKEDRGFRVVTPELDIVDLGTDFGVLSDPVNHDEVHVFSGSVEVAGRSGRKARETLAAGQARRADPVGRLEKIDPRPEDFLRSLPEGLPVLHFSFDEIDGGDRLKVSGNHPAAGRTDARLVPVNGFPRLVPGISGTALAFDGAGGHVVTDWPGISGIAPRTVTFWVKAEPGENLSTNPGITGWGDPRMPNGKWKLLLTQANPGGPAYPRISIGSHGYDAPAAANDGEWHHLAMSFSGKMGEDGHPELAIFLDGERQPLAYRHFSGSDESREPRTRTEFGAQALSIGAAIDATPGGFHGLIDELRIYPGVLSEEAIREQAAVLREAPAPRR